MVVTTEEFVVLAMYIFVACILAFSGFIFKKEKYYDFIAGYNTMSDAEKANFDIATYAHTLGNTSYVFAILLTISGVTFYVLSISTVVSVLVFIALLLLCVDIIFFRGDGKNKPTIKNIFILFLVHAIAIVLTWVSLYQGISSLS